MVQRRGAIYPIGMGTGDWDPFTMPSRNQPYPFSITNFYFSVLTLLLGLSSEAFSSTMACTMRLTKPMRASSHVHISSSMPIHSYQVLIFNTRNSRKEFNKQSVLLGQQNLIPVPKSSQPNDSVVPSEDDENGVSLGTMKLPPNTDLQRFDSLLFQVFYYIMNYYYLYYKSWLWEELKIKQNQVMVIRCNDFST